MVANRWFLILHLQWLSIGHLFKDVANSRVCPPPGLGHKLLDILWCGLVNSVRRGREGFEPETSVMPRSHLGVRYCCSLPQCIGALSVGVWDITDVWNTRCAAKGLMFCAISVQQIIVPPIA